MGYMVEPTTFDDDKFRVLSDGARVTWLCLLSGPLRLRLPGLMRAGVSEIAETLARSPDDIELRLQELVLAAMIEVDSRAKVIRVPKAPRYHKCPNARVLWSWWLQWKDLPECELKYAHLDTLVWSITSIDPAPEKRTVPVGSESLNRAWNMSFGHLLRELQRGTNRRALVPYIRSLPGPMVIQRKDQTHLWQQVPGDRIYGYTHKPWVSDTHKPWVSDTHTPQGSDPDLDLGWDPDPDRSVSDTHKLSHSSANARQPTKFENRTSEPPNLSPEKHTERSQKHNEISRPGLPDNARAPAQSSREGPAAASARDSTGRGAGSMGGEALAGGAGGRLPPGVD